MTVKLKKAKDLYPNSNWTAGTFEYRGKQYRFEAKIYPEPSCFGINDGNVSKLYVTSGDKKRVVFSYDRGLDVGSMEMMERGMIYNLVCYLSDYAMRTPLKCC